MNGETIFKLIIELLVGLSNYAWPAVVLVVAFMFRKPLRQLIENVRELELFGNKGRFTPKVDEFQKSVQELGSNVEARDFKQAILGNLGKAPTDEILINAEKEQFAEESQRTDEDIDQILSLSKNTPELAIIKIAGLLEDESKAILGSMGFLPSGRNIFSARGLLQEMEHRGLLPKNTDKSLNQFFDLRNRIVHGKNHDKAKEIYRVIDIGIELLKTVRNIRHEVHTIVDIMDLYDDDGLSVIRQGEKAIVIQSDTPDGGSLVRVFHTTNYDHYKKGDRVTWEWDFNKILDSGWIRSPKHGTPIAVGGSLDFAGRRLAEI
jgi:uncharacterized protein YutE (UPF0331/DUF86 family)